MLASVIREVIAPVLRECPPECGMASMTDVEVSPDYAYVTISVSALRQPELLLTYLEERRPALQRSIGGHISLRRIPLIRFRLDASVARSDRIDRLLQDEMKKLPQDTSSGAQEEQR